MARAKLLNFTSNIASLLFFTLGGKVVWSVVPFSYTHLTLPTNYTG
ncbi:hypothetical protein [Aeromonas caviae]|nr:hypothetical protein [Aeromonas caviae]